MDMQRTGFSRFALSAYFWGVIAFLAFPIFVIIPISFSNSQFLRFPPQDLGIRWYETYFNDAVWVSATILSFKVALLASLVATIVGTMAVISLDRGAARTRQMLTYLITAPIIIPHIFIALGVFILAIRFGFADSEIALAGAHATIAMPFVVLIVGAAMRQMDPTIERAARVLGAGPVRAFFSATFPSLLPAIVAAGVFAFFVSFDELIIAQFMLSGKETLPMRIWADLKLEVSPTVAAVSSLLIVVTTIAMVGAELLRRRAAGVRGD
ncbi:ABC transporter permease [Oceanibacterium hippocampi]|uniref:Inner membrane ABC transporter permease protein YdcV n=1 Tax=Oceanibacterium hippocampi TaxID=745714 RepID=A0A1Y5TWS7_9PROT|nr:ABC transporter permease [Oceanibacterium hippocampi]SLN75691.1 Inner membrane ABC transporter permease protein YdcV [Oceanibacterium hippocampi]